MCSLCSDAPGRQLPPTIRISAMRCQPTLVTGARCASATRKQILVADDELNLRRVLKAQLSRDGYDVDRGRRRGKARRGCARASITSTWSSATCGCPASMGWRSSSTRSRTTPGMPVILITAHGTVDTAVEALKLGAFDYITKPFEQTEFRNVVAQGGAHPRAPVRGPSLAAPAPPSPRVASTTHRPVRADASRSTRSSRRWRTRPSTVLITGESGTGKELIASALHEQLGRGRQALHPRELRRDPARD